jgi:hypothetical protein
MCRKALPRRVLEDAGYERIMYLDHVVGPGDELFKMVRRSMATASSRSGLQTHCSRE